MSWARLGAGLALAASLTMAGPAFGQTPPSPQPSSAAAPSPSALNFDSRRVEVSASTDQATGAVDYSARDLQSFALRGSSSSGYHVCIGESPAEAGIEFSSQGMSLTPALNGQILKFVGSVPSNANADPNAPGYNSPTLSNAVEYIVVCNGVPTGYGLYVPSPASAGTPAQLHTVAQSAAGSIPMPSVTIQTSPATEGIDGLNTWFWTAGYTGGPISVTRNALGASIEVIATPTSYLWDFGDVAACNQAFASGCNGTATLLTNSLGVPFQPAYVDNTSPGCDATGQSSTVPPLPSGAVTHCYRLPSGMRSVTVSVTFNFAVVYRVNGGPTIALPAIQRTATRAYPVIGIDSVLVCGDTSNCPPGN
jgi:hypothetical protein